VSGPPQTAPASAPAVPEAARSRPAYLAIVGTTASGKSRLALELARRRPDVELVSVDSMQVYRGMDIGTAKPSRADQDEVPHHLLDLADPWDEFTVADFQRAFGHAMAGIQSRSHRAVLVGGTGLYLRTVVDGLDIPGRYPDVRAEVEAEPDTVALHRWLVELDPVAAGRMLMSNRRRILRALEVTLGSGRPFSSYGPGLQSYGDTNFLLVGVRLPADVVARRIEERIQAQLDAGFLDEVRTLAAHARPLSRSARQALGYRELLAHVAGSITLEEAVDATVRHTRQFARRQRVWFRRDPRITWLDAEDDPMAVLPGLLRRFDESQASASDGEGAPEVGGAGRET
jgi:tRNA dimethylallyltransferase